MEKKRNYQRLGRTMLTLLLSVVMTVAFIPAWAFAEGEEIQTGEDILSGQEAAVTDEAAADETVTEENADSPEAGDASAEPGHEEAPDIPEETVIPEAADASDVTEETEETEEPAADNGTAGVISPETAEKDGSGLLAEKDPANVKASVDVPDSDELLMQFIRKKAQDAAGTSAAQGGSAKRAQSRKNSLSGPELNLYEAMAPQIEAIASGEEESADIRVPVRDIFGDRLIFSAEELGYDEVLVENPDPTGEDDQWIFADGIVDDYYDHFRCDTESVLNALLADMPYELYWFDKTKDCWYDYSCGIAFYYDEDTETEQIGFGEEDPDMIFSLCVSKDYSASGEEGTTEVDTAKTGAAAACAGNTAAIIDRYENDTDYEKLTAYKDEICDATDYNQEAVDLDPPYGDPWQLIWVFDGDDSTNVVCEGYSKAFQFLCDLTDFDSSEIECYQVSGVMNGGLGEGDHMWNILHMDDGENYLADITNCDEDGVGCPDALFIREDSGGAVGDYDYSFDCYGQTVSYAYDKITRSVYSDEELTLADSPYDPDGQGGGGGEEDFPFYDYVNENEYAPIFSDGDAVLRLDIPEGEDLPEFDRISLLQVGAAVHREDGQEFDWELMFERDNEFSFDEETLEITIHGDKAQAALEYGYIDVFIGGDVEDPETGEYTNVWLAGGHFDYYEPYEDYHMETERDMLIDWDGYIDKERDARIENSMYPYGEDVHYEVTSAVSSDPDIVTVETEEDWDQYRYCAVSLGDADITVILNVDGIAVPVVRVIRIHVTDCVYTADIWWPVGGSDNVLPGGTIDFAASAEREYKAIDDESEDGATYDVREPVDSDMFVWTVEEGEDVVSGSSS